MTIYTRDSDALTAVTAFRDQYSMAANGDIRFAAGTDTFHVYWLHRALQMKVWETSSSGDDFLNLGKPNPSTSEALGTIITLQDHTTNFGVRYNIDETVVEGLYGGSVEQQNASFLLQRFAGLKVLGTAVAGTQLQIIRDHAVYPSFWGTGLNQTESNVLLRCLVETINDGVEVDQQIVVVKASEFNDSYFNWEVTLGLGEAVAAISTVNDPQNNTDLATVQAYTGYAGVAATMEGYSLNDVDGNGADPFIGALSYASLTGNKNNLALYEVVKAMLSRGSGDTIFGIDADLYTARLYQLSVTPDSGSQLYVQNEVISWAGGGEGIFIGADDLDEDNTTRIVMLLTRGIAPVATDMVTGATNGASNLVTDTEKLSSAANLIGVYTGSNWLAEQGIGFLPSEMIFGDTVTALDGETPAVPQNVSLTVNIVCDDGDDPYVFLAEKNPDPLLTAPNYSKYTGTTQSSGAGVVIVDSAIDDDEPQTGYVAVLHTGDTVETYYEYVSWSGSTFTLAGTIDADIVAGDPAFIAFFYEAAVGTGAAQSVTRSFVYGGNTRDFIGWVRHGDPAKPDKPANIAFNDVGSNSQSVTVTLSNES